MKSMNFTVQKTISTLFCDYRLPDQTDLSVDRKCYASPTSWSVSRRTCVAIHVMLRLRTFIRLNNAFVRHFHALSPN